MQRSPPCPAGKAGTMSDRWIKQPGPGQMRGEGEWVEYLGSDDEWEWLRGTGFLPTAEGEKPVNGEGV